MRCMDLFTRKMRTCKKGPGVVNTPGPCCKKLFFLFDETEDDSAHYIDYVQLIRQRTGTLYSKKLNFALVELPKFRKTEAELETNTDRWLFCLRNLSRQTSRPDAVQGRIFEKLFKAAEIEQLTTKEMKACSSFSWAAGARRSS